MLSSRRCKTLAIHCATSFISDLPDFDVFYYGMNALEPPFDDVKVRQALNYAIDRETLATVLLSGVVTPTSKILPPGFPAYNPDLEGYPYDPDKARQLLAESKYGSDTSTYPLNCHYFPGILRVLSQPAARGNTGRPGRSSWVFKWRSSRPSGQPTWRISGSEGSRSSAVQAGLPIISIRRISWTSYCTAKATTITRGSATPRWIDILERARVEQDPQARVALYNEAEQLIIEQAPWAPLFHSNGDSYIIKPYVKGLPLTPLVIPRLRYVYFTE